MLSITVDTKMTAHPRKSFCHQYMQGEVGVEPSFTNRGNALFTEQCRLDMNTYSFSQGAINDWNKLTDDCINANGVNVFKN